MTTKIDHDKVCEKLRLKIALKMSGPYNEAEIRRALNIGDNGKIHVIRQNAKYWAGTMANEYAMSLGMTEEEGIQKLRQLGI